MNIKKIIAYCYFVLLLLLPVACKKDVEPAVTPPTVTGNVQGIIELPAGSSINSENLSVVTSFGQFTISNNKFTISDGDLENYRQLFVGDADGNILLAAIQFPNQKEIKINAVSTADALLMINPVIISLDNESRKKILEAYRKHSLYGELVKKVSESILAKKSPFDAENDELIENINKIHQVNSEKGGRTFKTSGLVSDDDVFEKRIIDNKTLGLTNKASGITYMAQVYDKSGNAFSEMLNLGQLRTENTSILDLFEDTYNFFSNFDQCYDAFGTIEVPAFCSKFNQNVFPKEQTVKFENPGEYTVKVANPLAMTESKELAIAATLPVLEFTVKDLLAIFDKSIADKLVKSTCYTNAAVKIAESGLRKYFTSSDKDDVKKVVKKLNDLVLKTLDELTKCQNEQLGDDYVDKRWLQFLNKAREFSKKIDIFSRVGAGVNLIHVARGILFHKEYYEFCVKYDGSTLNFCEELIETIGTKNITTSTATLQGRINFVNNENIVRFGFLTGSDPSKMGMTESLRQNVADLPGGLKTPYPYEMSFAFNGTGKIYYQAFAENQLGIVHRGEVMELIPENLAQSTSEAASLAKSIGDPHLTTFDGLTYSFMAAGEFVVSKSTVAGDKFEIQVRQQEIKSKNKQGIASFNTGIAIHTGYDKICVYPDKSIFINDKLSQIGVNEQALQNGGTIKATSEVSRLSITTPNKDLIEIQLFNSGDLDYFIWPNPNRKGKIRGLQGNFDGNGDNDLITSSGQAINNSLDGLYNLFGNSWRITQTNSLFTYTNETSTATYTDLNFPKQSIAISDEQKTRARTICENAGVTDPDILAGCITDVAITGDASYANRAQTAEVKKMLRSIKISNFNDIPKGLTLSNSKIIGPDWVPNENQDGIIRPDDRLYLNNGLETEIIFTLKDIYASGPALYLFNYSSLIDPNAIFSVGITRNNFDFEIGMLFRGEEDLAVNLIDGKKHKLKIVVLQSRVNQSYKCEIKLFLDDSSAPNIKADMEPSPFPFFSNTMNISLASRAITVHGWSLKSL